MKKLLVALGVASLVFLAGCASPTESKPGIPLSLSGGGTVPAGTSVTLVANPTYSGTGTLSYKWYVEGTPDPAKGSSMTISTTSKVTFNIRAEVTDGTSSGSATTSITWQ